MTFPDELRYTKDHEWIRVEGDTATIGVTDFAQSELGDIVYVEVETVGDAVGKDDVFGTVEAVKTVSELFMPVGGTVTEMNTALDTNPELVNDDPYGEGWLVKITLDNAADAEELLSSSEYADMVGQ